MSLNNAMTTRTTVSGTVIAVAALVLAALLAPYLFPDSPHAIGFVWPGPWRTGCAFASRFHEQGAVSPQGPAHFMGRIA